MADYLSFYTALRDVIPLIELLDEFWDQAYKLLYTDPKFYYKSFEENYSALEIVRLPKMWLRTKSINVVNHQFQEYVCIGLVSIYPVSTDDQLAHIFTKPLI